MKKVININFQGRVVPIEETAYELLKQYVDSLRRYFANEEGRDEIVNDIEGRIAELFAEKLKAGLPCITDADVNAIIADMGRPEDLEAEQADIPPSPSQPQNTGGTGGTAYKQPAGKRSLYRNADDKILAGVCSGIANFLNIDPVVMRIVFVLLFGVLFWVYLLLWIIVPSKSIESNITKRLYRNPDQKMIAGVCGGIASYFNMDVWIPRLIFALPFVFALASSGFHRFWWNWDFGWTPWLLSGSLGWTMFITYVVLWISVPFANTSSEKLEMRGEKVDLNSIRNTVKEDLENFRSKAEKFGGEVKTTARQFGEKAGSGVRAVATDAGPAARRVAGGLGHAIIVLLKAFFIFIFAIVAIALFSVFVALVFGGVALAPLKGFVLEGAVQHTLFWLTLVLFFMIPMIALVTWGIRRIVGARSKKHYVGLTFLALWIGGLVSGIALLFSLAGDFRSTSSMKEEQILTATNRRISVGVEGAGWKDRNHHFFGMHVEGDNLPFYDINEDSIFLTTVKLSMVKSADSAFHVYRVRESRGSSAQKSNLAAANIQFEPTLHDSLLLLPSGFGVGRGDKFRNQRVWVVIEVPVGREITFSDDIRRYNWFIVHSSNKDVTITSDDDSDDDENADRSHDNINDLANDRGELYRPLPGLTYVMHADGRPRRVDQQ